MNTLNSKENKKPQDSFSPCVTPNNTNSQNNESDVLKQLALGHSEAMNYLFDNYYQLLCSRAYSYIKEYDKAEDLVQDVMLNIWKKREELDIQISLKAYLFRCVTNRSLNYIRDNKVYNVELDHSIQDHSHSIE